MRIPLIVVGMLIAALGAAAYTGALSFPHEKEVLKIGDVSATVTQEKTVPQWAGGVAIVVGFALVIVGATRKR